MHMVSIRVRYGYRCHSGKPYGTSRRVRYGLRSELYLTLKLNRGMREVCYNVPQTTSTCAYIVTQTDTYNIRVHIMIYK